MAIQPLIHFDRQKFSFPGIFREMLSHPPPVPRGFKVVSWNVAGLRSLVNKNKDELLRLVETEKPALLFLQETKLQPSHTEVGLEVATPHRLVDYSFF